MISLQTYLMWLRGLDTLAGLPIILIGLAVMLGGWRMGRVCVILSCAAIGAGVGWHVAHVSSSPWLALALGGGLVTGVLGFLLRAYAAPVLGGAIGAAVVMQLLIPFRLDGWPWWISFVLAFACAGALCMTNLRLVVIIITSLEGALLLVSGLVPIMTMWPGLLRFFESTNRVSWIFFPFMVLVPAIVGYFLQVADSRRHPSGSARA
ncbi:MAG: hypothetical protein GY842_07910 [bacterium]|nr:hypothetical protein [bacterium]